MREGIKMAEGCNPRVHCDFLVKTCLNATIGVDGAEKYHRAIDGKVLFTEKNLSIVPSTP